MQPEYQQFLESKIKVATRKGMHVDRSFFHTSLRPDQVDMSEWAIDLGAALVAPDAGMGTTGVRALKKGRKAYIIELNELYAKCAATYLKETEYKNEIPTLFDLIEKTA